MTALRRSLLLAALMTICCTGLAHAQPFAYSATPPTLGALYRDGQTGRYLLGSTWLYRPDLAEHIQPVLRQLLGAALDWVRA